MPPMWPILVGPDTAHGALEVAAEAAGVFPRELSPKTKTMAASASEA